MTILGRPVELVPDVPQSEPVYGPLGVGRVPVEVPPRRTVDELKTLAAGRRVVIRYLGDDGILPLPADREALGIDEDGYVWVVPRKPS